MFFALVNYKSSKAIRQSFKELGPTAGKGPIRKGARAAAKLFQQKIKPTVPKKTGKLKKALKVRAGKSTKKYVGAWVTTGDPRVKNLNSGAAFYGSFLELGSKSGSRKSKNRRQIPAKPFMRPAFKMYKRPAAQMMIDTIYNEIPKAVAKIAMKNKAK